MPNESIYLFGYTSDSDEYKLAKCLAANTSYCLTDRVVRMQHVDLVKIILNNTRYQRLTFKALRGSNMLFKVDGKVDVCTPDGKFEQKFIIYLKILF